MALKQALGSLSLLWLFWFAYQYWNTTRSSYRPSHPLRSTTSQQVLARCQSLHLEAGPPPNFHLRSKSDRFVPGTRPVLLRNAKIWTGQRNGTDIVQGDILLDNGLIQNVGRLDVHQLNSNYGDKLRVIDVNGAWVTPGIVDVHSHLGVYPSPALLGVMDGNSEHGTIQPWLRSLDGLNSHDEAYLLSISGGVTTSLILPGSSNAIGGQAFVMKLRQTAERSPTSMLLEPPHHINASFPNPNLPPRWRHMKHACGENPSDQYNSTRMDTIWAFREAYNKAKAIKERQDEFCARVLSGQDVDEEYPENLQWEALVDVLRGRVKVNIHCYEAVDFDGLVRISNEFQFPIAAFHHAHEAFLVPDLIKKAYGKPPAIALFATNARYKREAYRASEFAPRILATHGLTVLMKSDHAVLNSRYLLYEAQQAYFYGLPWNLAIASVTSNSAEVMGMGHRIGYIRNGWDADIVVWDSHPLALGATPSQVFIDGIPQLDPAFVVRKPDNFQRLPKVPKFDKQAEDAVKYEGLPPLEPKRSSAETVVFTNVKTVFQNLHSKVNKVFSVRDGEGLGVVVTVNGSVVCHGASSSCLVPSIVGDRPHKTVDLDGGSILPGLSSFGSPLGLENINQEPSTNDGDVFDAFEAEIPRILGGETSIVHAVDGLQFVTRDALLAYRAGVTSAITAPTHKGFFSGLGTSFSLGALNRLERGAIIQHVTGVHISMRRDIFDDKPSTSSQIAALRRMLLNTDDTAAGYWFGKVARGEIPLIVEAHSADVIATLIILKREVEIQKRARLKLTITGGSEAALLAKELAADEVGVILNPARPYPTFWGERRILPGPPLTRDSAVLTLVNAGVVVGIGCEEIWSARNLPFDLGWIAIESGGKLSKEDTIALGSTNLLKLLGVEDSLQGADLVATRGGDILETGSQVVAVISPRQGRVDLI